MNNILKLFLIIDLVIVNTFVALLVYNLKFPAVKTTESIDASVPNSEEVKSKDLEDIRGQLGSLVNRIGNLELTPYPSPAGTSGQIKTVAVAVPTRQINKNISYVNIPGSGETNLLAWTDIAGTDFYFDKSEYPGLLNITLETSIKLFNGSGMGYIRIFDVSHGIAAVGSDVSTNSQTDTLITSGLINLWSGRNLYRIQAKSNSSDRILYNWGKLKITTQN